MSKIQTKAHIRSSFRDSIYTSLNIGLSENYFCAFLLALGIPAITAGLGVILAQFIGVCLQVIFIRFFFQEASLKKRLQIFLSIQAATMLPLIWSGLTDQKSPWLLVSILGLYWACVLSLNPPWNKLIAHTVPRPFLLKFFSIRNQFGQFSVLAGLVASGCLLAEAQVPGSQLTLFAVIFGIGFLLKTLSCFEITKFHLDHSDYGFQRPQIGIRQFLSRLKGSDQGRLVSFLFFFYVAVYSASPYFTPYMLNQLKFSYSKFMIIIACSYTGRILTYRLLQRWLKSRQVNGLLIFCAIGISTSPLLWSISQNFGWLLIIEFLSGSYWAGFELSTTLIYYKKIEDHDRTRIMSYISFFNVTGMTVGSLIGAGIMQFLPPDIDKYLFLFVVATFLRLSVIIFLPHVKIKGELPQLLSFSLRQPFAVATRPIFALFEKKKK